MTPSLAGRLLAVFGERVRFDEPLAPYTTYRIGGPADALVEPGTVAEVVQALDIAREAGVPWLALGLGSNVLVADAGVRGIVMRIGRGLAEVGRDGARWCVGAGVPTPLLARRTAAAGVAGVHRLVGVPGTVGGGVYMNAGAHGQEFRHVVRHIDVVTGAGAVERRSADQIAWRYRSSGLADVVVVSAALQLEPGDPVRLEREVAEHLRWRKAGTPFNEPCCGSVFRNPTGPLRMEEGQGAVGGEGGLRTAGQMIDAVGMKGFRVGGAEVSRIHANYIVNTGGATARDVLRAIDAVRERVAAAFATELELEVKLIGVP
jgi:UDP-N-acetylmuramate dehydrogenase